MKMTDGCYWDKKVVYYCENTSLLVLHRKRRTKKNKMKCRSLGKLNTVKVDVYRLAKWCVKDYKHYLAFFVSNFNMM